MQTGAPLPSSYGNISGGYTKPAGEQLPLEQRDQPGIQVNDSNQENSASLHNPALDASVMSQIGMQARKDVKKEEPEEITEEATIEVVKSGSGIEETQQLDDKDKAEQKLLRDMKKTIYLTGGRVSRKVNKSALKYMTEKKNWIADEHKSEAEEFLTIKIPKVMARELSKILNEVLGLDISEGENSTEEVA